jgi:hypothetical protein
MKSIQLSIVLAKRRESGKKQGYLISNTNSNTEAMFKTLKQGKNRTDATTAYGFKDSRH